MQDEIIKQAIKQRAGDGTSKGDTAGAVVVTLRLLHAELGLLIGLQAASALCAHALHRTRSEVRWTTPPAATMSEQMLAALRDDLNARTPVRATFAGETLLLALVDHLVSLIGEPLTLRMLRSAWAIPTADQNFQENF